jgi:hypothetical protein
METIYSLFHGTIAGGAACYLKDRLVDQEKSRNPDVWTTAALQFNHLLLLTAETVISAGFSLGICGLLVRTIYVLTPLILLVGLREEKISNLERGLLVNFNIFYYTCIVVNIIATFELGNPAFAIASLALMLLNAFATDKLAKILVPIKTVLANCALIGYGAQVFTAEDLVADLAKISTAVMGMKLWFSDNFDKKKSVPNTFPSPVNSHPVSRSFYYPNARGVTFPSTNRWTWKWGNPFVRSGVWS